MKKYISPFSIDYRTPVYIDSNDPRAKHGNLQKNIARYGRKIKIVENNKMIKLDKYIAESTTSTSTVKFIAFKQEGVSGTSYYSTDAEIWTPISEPITGTVLINNVIYGNNKFVAVDQRGIACYSENGIDWILTELPFLNPLITYSPIDITYGNNKFVINDYYGNCIWYSMDGITWTAVSLSNSTNSLCIAINYVDNKYVITNSNSNVIESTDAITWSTASYGTNSQFFTKLNNNYISIYYTNSYFTSSTDKANWTIATNTLIYNARRMIYANNIYIALGQGGLSYSTNLTEWTLSNITGSDTAAITYGNDQFFAANNNGLLSSTDGIAWTQIMTGQFKKVYCKTYEQT